MKRSTQLLTLAFVVLLTLAFVTAGCVTSNTSPSSVTNTSTVNTSATKTVNSTGMVSYQNTSWGFKFSYPEGWHTLTPANAETGNYFVTQPFKDTNAFTVIIYKYAKATAERSNNTDAALNKINETVATGKSSPYVTNYTVLQGPTRVTLAGEQGWSIKTSMGPRDGSVERIGTFVLVSHGNYLYGIGYNGNSEDYNKYLATAQQIIDSFEFI